MNIFDGRILVVTGEVANQRRSARLLAGALVTFVARERRVTSSRRGQSVNAVRIRQAIVFDVVEAACQTSTTAAITVLAFPEGNRAICDEKDENPDY